MNLKSYNSISVGTIAGTSIRANTSTNIQDTHKYPSLHKSKIKILLLEGVHSSASEVFQAAGYEMVEWEAGSLEDTALLEALSDVHIIGVRSRTQLTDSVLKHAKKLIAVGCFCIGTNQVEIHSAALLGIPVFNAPFSNTRSVAELIICEIIMLFRGVNDKNQKMHAGVWCKSASQSFEIRGKTLGIIGYGHIGAQVSVLAESLGMQVLYYDIEAQLPLGNAIAMPNMQALLASSDVVSLHVPGTVQTAGLLDESALRGMKSGSFLINASRGDVVDVDALKRVLNENHLYGAALDVFPSEPVSNADVFHSSLQGLSNVILTPHIAGSTQEAQANIGQEVAYKLVKFSDNGSTMSAVNFPEVSLPRLHAEAEACRILHIHRNVPGILGKVNDVFASSNLNILGQYLQTKGEIGYLVIDFEMEGRYADLLDRLKQLPETIRTRILF